MNDTDESEIFSRSRADKTYVGPAFPDFVGRNLRIANKYIDAASGYAFANVKDEIVLRETPAGRFQIKVTFLEDDRSFQTVTLQRFSSASGAKEHFTFMPAEVATLLAFLSNLKRIHFPNAGKVNVTDSDLEQLLLQPAQVLRLAADNQQLLADIARNEITIEDVVSLGYRKKQLRVFERLLSDEGYFAGVLAKHAKGPEEVWQRFFELNPWIFGASLSLINFGPLDNRKMEQAVRGFSISGPGKRVDALLKSHALISTTCFVEIKRHDTPLLASSEYRSGIWQPSSELSGAVAQVQGTVSAALEAWRAREEITDSSGEPSGETLFTTEPRSYVICGRLSEFHGEHGVNERRFRSFELFRRNLNRPEVVTFDELYERACFIVSSRAYCACPRPARWQAVRLHPIRRCLRADARLLDHHRAWPGGC
ncbi:Shedu immune nuclease family protein [Devosia lacusdianchii]|uniref:Shedu immune nuclease family protein n=1 Tax=Devosia lacusdianchii TaxID=2917991 RepID=UPI001F06AA76|nr:Shedu immune nuclease family protein [Devosia sp. JXJ CY 41]